jgi:outer membrane protein OmpA-like peptidoglycan-associated protein
MIALAIGAVACSHDPTRELVAARSAYEDASNGAANELAPADVYEAGKALAAAEQAHADYPGSDKERDLAYVAHRKSELATAKAEQFIAREDQQNAKRTYVSALEQSRDANEAKLRELDAAKQMLGSERDRRADLEHRLDQVAKMRQENGRTIITLDGSVLFSSDSANLKGTSMAKLQKVADVISEYDDDFDVTIEGYTDSRGSAKHNRDLSEKRATAVKDFLVGHGVDSGVVTAVGKGEDGPIAPNNTAEGRAENRRVELVIAPKPGHEQQQGGGDKQGKSQ